MSVATPTHTRTLKVDMLARVEGEGGLYIKLRNGIVADVRLKIFEPPRFFEAFLRGRSFTEVPDITARICGICPVAYQMSSVHAMEAACGITVGGPLRELRRLLYCGEWIESHALHVYFLHAPDFLGYPDAIAMAADHRGAVEKALELKKTGNDLMTFLAGREIHPINVRVGGFYKTPARKDLMKLRDGLQRALDLSLETVRFAASLDFPDFEPDYEFVALRHPAEYPFNEGRIVSNRGLDIEIADYERHFVEEHVEHSNALHSIHRGAGSYFVGPQARYSLNFDRLPPAAQHAAREAGLGHVCRNPFQSIVVRAVELVFACEEALRIVDCYEQPDAPAVEVPPRKAVGHACTEAPRGILYHRYSIDEHGLVTNARIVPPTSQNQRQIEADLRSFVERNLHLDDAALTHRCEQAIRNYDPCISCATHALKLTIDRG